MSLSNAIVDLLFPKKCVGCLTFGVFLCRNCRQNLPIVVGDVCPYCKKHSYFGLTHPVCKHNFGLDGLKSIFYYDGLVKKIITQIKYKRVKEAFIDLVHAIPQTKRDELAFYKQLTTNPILVPVPLHIKREKQRGFNQSREIARYIAHFYQFAVEDALVTKTKHTLPQAHLSGAPARNANIHDAFSVVPSVVSKYKKGMSFILVDDVWTTGATVRELCKTLKKQIPCRVYALTLSRVRSKGEY